MSSNYANDPILHREDDNLEFLQVYPCNLRSIVHYSSRCFGIDPAALVEVSSKLQGHSKTNFRNLGSWTVWKVAKYRVAMTVSISSRTDMPRNGIDEIKKEIKHITKIRNATAHDIAPEVSPGRILHRGEVVGFAMKKLRLIKPQERRKWFKPLRALVKNLHDGSLGIKIAHRRLNWDHVLLDEDPTKKDQTRDEHNPNRIRLVSWSCMVIFGHGPSTEWEEAIYQDCLDLFDMERQIGDAHRKVR